MRILFATYTLAFQNPGGGEQVLLSLKRALGRLGVGCDLYDPFRLDPREYDVTHYFSCVENAFWPEFKRLFPSKPLVVTPTLYQPASPGAYVATVRQLFLRELGLGKLARYGAPDLWLPTTETEARRLERFWRVDSRRVRVLPNGVDAGFARGDAGLFRRRFGVEGPFVLCVGRFCGSKNQLALIEALKDRDLQLVLVGDADVDAASYHAACLAAARGARARIRFVPRLEHDDPLLAGAYAAADVFVLPSRFETFSIAALEAAVAGCAMVLTGELWSRPLFAPHARFVDVGDRGALARAVVDSFGRRDKIAAGGLRARLLVASSWDAIAARLLRHYEEVLGR